MGKTLMSGQGIYCEETTNLDEVEEATTGSAIDMRSYDKKAVWVIVSGNTGSVKVTIQVSPDGTNWMDLQDKTYAATNTTDVFNLIYNYPYVRTKTSSQTNSTVTTIITGRS